MSPIIERMKVAFLQENKRSPDTRRGLSSEETWSDRMRVTVEQAKDAIPPPLRLGHRPPPGFGPLP